jgi:hypothetical protein
MATPRSQELRRLLPTKDALSVSNVEALSLSQCHEDHFCDLGAAASAVELGDELLLPRYGPLAFANAPLSGFEELLKRRPCHAL